MKHVLAISTITLAVLAACSSNLNSNPVVTVVTAQPQKFVGLLEVRISGVGDTGTPASSATFVSSSSLKSGLNAKTVTVIPVNGSSALNDVQIIPATTSFFDDDRSNPPQRFINSSFDLINRTSTIFNNLTLYAVSVPSITLGGTAVADIRTAANTAITNTTIPRSFIPAHAMRPTRLGLEVNPNLANLQWFTPLEVNNPITSAAFPNGQGVQQQAIAQNIVPASSTVLEYGFVGRNRSGSRSIAARNSSTDCTVDACKGTVTLSYKLQRLNPRASNPWAFSLYFVVADDEFYNASQSLEEQTPNTVAGDTYFGWDEVRTLAGTTYAENDMNYLCRVRIAVTPDAFLMGSPSGAGSLDACFDMDGKLTTDFYPDSASGHAMAIQTDGKIVLAGNSTYDFALARYNTNGSLDSTFDGDGKLITDFPSSDDDVFAIGIQADGKIVVAGYSKIGSNFDVLLARFNTNGSLDTTFDTDGKVVTDFGSSDEAYALGIQADGKIVVAGYSKIGSSNSDVLLARFNTNGSLDTTFDTDGKVVTDFGSTDEAHALGIQADGKIVTAGASGGSFALARYSPNGALDTTFDTDGKVITPIALFDSASALGIQADGKIVVSGSITVSYPPARDIDFALVRYNTNGSLDTTFDGDGKVTTAFAGLDGNRALGIQADGKIVVAGHHVYSGSDFALARYNP
jgi:uncharacterized delta-60 repeat protein